MSVINKLCLHSRVLKVISWTASEIYIIVYDFQISTYETCGQYLHMNLLIELSLLYNLVSLILKYFLFRSINNNLILPRKLSKSLIADQC